MDRYSLDRSIDKVARGLTAGDPSAAFRQRVAARLPGTNDRSGKPWFWIGGLVATAGAIAIAVLPSTQRRIEPSVTSTASAHRPIGTSKTIEPSSRHPVEGPADLTLEPSNRRTSNPNPRTLEPRTLEPSIEARAWESRAIAPLSAPEAPSPMTNIQPEPLEIRPLVTPALVVPALGEEDEDR